MRWQLILLALCAFPCAAAPRLVTDISEHHINIEYRFAGADLLLFGAIQGLSPRLKPDIIVIVRGPSVPLTVRRKGRVLGIWLNVQSTEFHTAPSYYALSSTNAVDAVAAPQWRAIYEIGLDSLHFSPSSRGDASSGDLEQFRNGFVALRRKIGLFDERPGGVELIDNSLFRTRITLPPKAPVGDYRAEVYLFTHKRLAARQVIPFTIEKSGIERDIYTRAHETPLSYGFGAVFMALFAGLLAARILQR